MRDMQYHFRKCYPIVSVYLLLLFVMIWFVQGKLQADTYGKTQFKECVWCGQVNYQSSPVCSACPSTQFRDIYFKPDAEKRDKKLKAKDWSHGIESEMNQLYEMYITPIELLIYRLGYDQEKDVKDLIVELMVIREELIDLYKLDKYRRVDYQYHDD